MGGQRQGHALTMWYIPASCDASLSLAPAHARLERCANDAGHAGAKGLTKDEKMPPPAEALKRKQGRAPLSPPHGADARVTWCGLSFTCAVHELASNDLSMPILACVKPPVIMTERCYIVSERTCSSWL